ncbi:BLUF domain-containing protein [Nitrosomonas aestuarii]|uniref:BLUF domain-containing protein n=1 Tax=Nitrosomonas aestuarii TaxID=52441 RepID=UPI000D2F5390|nr:BLUF domain-containing protein [Nitrosomonas aestuarii]PTN11821.1 NADH dehydrogenase FAD-containing subunit [Nitrosomonas aestuarii]
MINTHFSIRFVWYVAFLLFGFSGLLVFSSAVLAHETWILTPEQIDYWNAQKLPDIFTQVSSLNVLMISAFLAFIIGWVWLGFTGARELFPDLQARLSSYGDHVPRILRVCVGWILLSSAFGAEPRFGVEAFTSPTFLAPDLELNQLGSEWAWIRWAEIILGLTILFGVYVRFFSFLLILLSLLGWYLFGEAIFPYLGAIIGASIFLVLQGAGRHFLPLPIPAAFRGIQSFLANQPRQRAQAIMRILTGTTILYLGVFYKLLQPNLSMGIIETYQLPILSIHPEAFTLLMALVEVSAGVLLIAGILLRPLSIFLISAFSIFALLLPETPTAHILFYGVVLSCFINSAGHLRRPVPRDKAADIVIIGGGLAALQAAVKIEKLIGQYSNVRITLLHEQGNFLFAPFLPEVIGGTVQPGNVVNPFRRIVQRTNVVVAHLDAINEKEQKVIAKRKNNETIELKYDSLILALTPSSHITKIPGMMDHACPIDSIADALRIRQRVLDLVEEAEMVKDADEKKRLLTFAIIGSSEIASAIAVEVSQILQSAEPSYPALQNSGWQVHLFNEYDKSRTKFEHQISSKRSQCLKKAGVIEHLEEKISGLTQKGLVFEKGDPQAFGLLINASFEYPTIRFVEHGSLNWPFVIDNELRLQSFNNIWVAESHQNATTPQFVFASDQVNLGQSTGFNAWANSQGFSRRPFKQQRHFVQPYNMRQFSLCRVSGLIFTGILAWFISRFINLLSVPGLERNLRIIIDWFLVLAFRSDIAVLAQTSSSSLEKSHFKAGDEIFSQGDTAKMAYVVESGRLKVIQNGIKIRELGPGDHFGEILPIHQNKRTETVQCLTDCELKNVSQEDLGALIKSGWLMSKAIRNLRDFQPDTSLTDTSLGLKRLTYVSKLSVPLDQKGILEIGRKASLNNQKIDVTGILIGVGDYFFQILEGEETTINVLIEKISRDPRHRDVTILSAETGCEERLFSDWNMKAVTLNESNDLILLAISLMLQNIAQSHNAMGRYTQPALLKFLMEGIDPLTIPIKSARKIVVSGSLTDFVALRNQFSDEELVCAVNNFLEICSIACIEYGGQVIKYSGGCFVAHFEIHQIDSAIASCVDAFNKFKEQAKLYPSDKVMNCGFGLASGMVAEGNIGSSIKMDYTILGNAVNQAIRLGEIARNINKVILIDESFQIDIVKSWKFEDAGTFEFKETNESRRVYALEYSIDS